MSHGRCRSTHSPARVQGACSHVRPHRGARSSVAGIRSPQGIALSFLTGLLPRVVPRSEVAMDISAGRVERTTRRRWGRPCDQSWSHGHPARSDGEHAPSVGGQLPGHQATPATAKGLSRHFSTPLASPASAVVVHAYLRRRRAFLESCGFRGFDSQNADGHPGRSMPRTSRPAPRRTMT